MYFAYKRISVVDISEEDISGRYDHQTLPKC